MVELHGQRVLEKIPPQRLLEEQPRPVGMKAPSISGQVLKTSPGAHAGDDGAEIDLAQDENENRKAAHPQPQRRCTRAERGRKPLRGPQDGGENAAGERKVERQPILRHAHPIGEPGRNHPPADRAKRGTEAENGPQPPAQRRLDRALPQEPKKRQQERGADHARQQAVRPFPPVDGLELVEAHAVIELAVLRDRLVFVELGLPGALVERRHDTGDGLPLDDRQPRFREPRGAADQQRHHHEPGNHKQPQPHGMAARGIGGRRHSRGTDVIAYRGLRGTCPTI